MKKYLELARISWQQGFVYRLNFIMWRVRQILSLLTAYFLWKAIFSQSHELFGYTESTMLTYVVVAFLVQTVVLSVRSIDLAGVITSGDLSNILVKPISNFWYWFSRDAADKLLNIIFSLGELFLLLFLLKPSFVFPPVLLVLLVVLVVLPLSTFLYYLINYLFGLLGFWTPDVWAPRFFLFILLQSVAGVIFPLDVFPQWLQQLVAWTPFSYLVYFPTQVFLSRLDPSSITKGIGILTVWILIFLQIVNRVWKKGLHVYSSEGR